MDTLLTSIGDVAPALSAVLQQLISARVIASAVHAAATESTNSDALVELQTGSISDHQLPRLYVADCQTNGRGRQGKSWISAGESLTFSLLTRIDLASPAASILSLGVGVAVARAIEFAYQPCRIELKWPNDLCVCWSPDGVAAAELHKLGGILIETAAAGDRGAVIGVGLNLGGIPQLVQAGHLPPTSLAAVVSGPVRAASLLPVVIESLLEMFEEMQTDPDGLIDQYRSRCPLDGKSLSLNQHGELVTGYCTGVTRDGSLELVVDGKRQQFRSGEVQRVRTH